MEERIGIGYDIHRLVEGRKLFIGGVEIPYHKGLLGHSDADVLLHAICDALLGACGQGDIGEHFPDTDPKYRDIASTKLLEEACEIIKGKGFLIGNIDSVIIAEEPKLLPLRNKIIKKISQLLKINEEKISLKAKTNEGLDAIGQGQAIACYAVALIEKE
ncbi:MAG: 2-C-methyl-D-erythritol 2,4-cyclodiphosphate synthase [Candidatus Omnitrophica bacterium]|nr:2-C-methyl-D-erythritol 2,4-cyclodiphosphate synthase [Candidatus Omnitrophota bacterium]